MLNSQCEIINKPLSVFLILKGYRGKKHAQCSNYAQSVEAANRTCSIKKVFCVRAYFLIAKNTFFYKRSMVAAIESALFLIATFFQYETIRPQF